MDRPLSPGAGICFLLRAPIAVLCAGSAASSRRGDLIALSWVVRRPTPEVLGLVPSYYLVAASSIQHPLDIASLMEPHLDPARTIQNQMAAAPRQTPPHSCSSPPCLHAALTKGATCGRGEGRLGAWTPESFLGIEVGLTTSLSPKNHLLFFSFFVFQ